MNRVPRVTVLYEDDRGPTKGFGLHALVKMCVFDRVNGERHRFESLLDYVPKKGAPSLLNGCRQDLPDLIHDGRSIVAVFDDDRVRRLLSLPGKATAIEVERAIKVGCAAPESLAVVLLERNTETVLRAAGECDESIDRDQLRRAVSEKSRLDRDAILSAAARESMRGVRDCILGRVPSLRQLIDCICERLSPPTPSDPPPRPTRPGRKR